MTEFEKQIAARLQALEFLVQGIVRAHFQSLTPAEAAQHIAQLERQFSSITIPKDAAGPVDLDEVMSMHSDAQFSLSRVLARSNPHQR